METDGALELETGDLDYRLISCDLERITNLTSVPQCPCLEILRKVQIFVVFSGLMSQTP